jgi:hypothetical protein
MAKSKKNKKKITSNSMRWWRFIIALVILIVTWDMLQEGTYSSLKIIILLILSGIIYLLWKDRRLKYDRKNLYIQRGKEETNFPLTNIVSIKKSKTKINGQRFWVLTYVDKQNIEKKLRFKSNFNKEFHNTVRQNNPNVIISTHPFF